MHDFELYLQLLTQNSFCFFAQKTLFADSFIQTLFPCSPGLFFENTILVLATRHPVLMSTPHQASLRIAFLADAQHSTLILGTSPHKGPYGATRLHPFLGRVWSRRDLIIINERVTPNTASIAVGVTLQQPRKFVE